MGHAIVRATLPCGEVVLLDPTGAQFGWKEMVAPWSLYKERRIHSIIDNTWKTVVAKPPGSRFVKPEAQAFAAAGVVQQDSPLELLIESVALGLLSQIKAKFDGGVKGFLQLKEGEFSAARKAVVDAAKRGLSMLAEEMNNGARMAVIPYVPVARNPTWKQQREGPELIWYYERDVKLTNNDPAKLRQRWKARWDRVIKIELPAPSNA